MGKVMIAHASKDESGAFKNGKAGDQTGQEVTIRSWYKRPWNVLLRPKSPSMANKIAECMEKACKNDHIGYDQWQRNSLLAEARKYSYDPGRVTKDVETDCSALVTLACIYAGIPESKLYFNNNSATTRTLRKLLMDTGLFLEFTAEPLVNSPKECQRGDILLYEGHHVAVVVSTTYTAAPYRKSNSEIAKEVIRGLWGSDPKRSIDLKAAGYDPEAIRAEVNRYYKEGKK